MTTIFARRACAAGMLVFVAFSLSPEATAGQAVAVSSSHVVIPFLANATKPTDLGFEGGECELDASRNRMDCTFQQVFLTTTSAAPDTCLVTTNRYQRAFRRETTTRWVSSEGPEGVCGLLDVVTLEDGGGVRWTMEMRKIVTKKDASPTCRALDDQVETLSWRDIRRPLPCRFVQPGGLSR